MPALHLFQRSSTDSFSLTIHSPITIAGLTVIALTFFVISSWLGFRVYRKRAAAKRESKMGAAFLSVKGLVQDDGLGNEKDEVITSVLYSTYDKIDTNPAHHRPFFRGPNVQINVFSRQMMDSTIVLPEKAIVNPVTLPKPFARTSASFAPSGGPRFSTLDSVVSREISQVRNSFGSFANSRFSVVSGASSISNTSGTTRKVRQKFEPVLPDELLPALGEQLTIVQSFDDGWCVVGRTNSTFVHTAKSLFKSPSEQAQNIELGVVPAWCFLKPVKGLRAERPIRNTSLGITVNIDEPGVSSRNELISWSNF